MRFLLTSLLCMTLMVTSARCQDDDTPPPEPDVEGEGADEEGTDDDQAETGGQTDAEDTDNNSPNTEPEGNGEPPSGEPQDAATTQAPGDTAATCTLVSMATCLSIAMLQFVIV